MEKFITSIKKKYQERRLHHEKQWPPCHSSKLITLLLVNRKVGEGYFGNEQRGKATLEQTRNSLHYSELFKIKSGKKPVRKVLVEGDAGIGKTTFCLSLSEDWVNGKIFQQFELLLFLPLRLRVVSSAGSLLELLKLLHPSTKVCESVASYLEEEEGEKVLIIADGWDELDKSGQQEGSFLYRLFFEDLPFASVILTSRPTASASLHQLPCIDRRIEIHGFNKVKSREYIQSEFTDDQEKAKRLLKQLKVTPFAESICSIPLNCAILCHLWRTCEEALPTTMTGLYTKVILNIILHNLQKREVSSSKGIKSLVDFEALPADLVESWQLLCEFAYRAMEEDQIVFSREKLVCFFPQGLALDQKILCFGLLQSAEPILETGYGVSFHFLHQVFQEYLAALHIVSQPPDKQLEIMKLEPNKSNSDINEQLLQSGLINNDWARFFMNMLRSQRFCLVWRFFCGIYFSDYNVKAQQPNVEHLIEPLLNMNKSTFLLDGWLHLCLLAFEARNEIVSQKVLQSLHEASKLFAEQVSFPGQKNLIEPATNLIVLGRPFLSAYDCAAIVYLVSTIQECTTLKLVFSYSGIGEDSIRALADALANKNGELQIQRLSLDGNRLTDKCLSDLFGRASAAFKSLQTLEVSDNRIRAVSLHSIAAPMEKFSFRRLLTLNLSHNRLGVSGVQVLDKVVCSYTLAHLHSLNLQGCLTDDAGLNAKLLIAFAIHSHQLCVINLSYNNLGIPGAIALSMIISKTNYFVPKLYSKAIKEAKGSSIVEVVGGPYFTVTINETNLGDLGLMFFVEKLVGDIHFDTLDMRGNGIHDTGISHLIQAIYSRKIVIARTVYEFDLGNNPFGTGGALVIGKMLSSHSYEFAILNLSQCQLTRTETVPPSSDPDSNNMIFVRDVGQQLCQMPQRCTLIDLNLDDNSFTGEDIYILAGFMHLCPSLKLLSCSNCWITSEDLLQLFDILCGQFLSPSQRPCSELIGWYLNHNIIDDRGLAALLEHLPSLFSQLGCDAYQNIFEFRFDDNPVSAEMATRVNDEMKRRKEVNCH